MAYRKCIPSPKRRLLNVSLFWSVLTVDVLTIKDSGSVDRRRPVSLVLRNVTSELFTKVMPMFALTSVACRAGYKWFH